MRPVVVAPWLFLLGCASTPDTPEPQPAEATASQPPAPASVTSSASTTPQRTSAESIVAKRRVFVRGAAPAGCEAWDIEMPELLDETRGRFRRGPSPPGAPGRLIPFGRRDNTLSLGPACATFGKQQLCLPCNATSTDGLSAFARLDDCEANYADVSATLGGCAEGLTSAWLEKAASIVRGEPRDTLMKHLGKAREISLVTGRTCHDFFVRVGRKRVFLDDVSSEYPTEIKLFENGSLSIGEVAERNPRYRARPTNDAIAIGCCGGGDFYRVLEVDETRAILMKVSSNGFGQVGESAELRLSACRQPE